MDTQADLSLCWTTYRLVGFAVFWLNSKIIHQLAQSKYNFISTMIKQISSFSSKSINNETFHWQEHSNSKRELLQSLCMTKDDHVGFQSPEVIPSQWRWLCWKFTGIFKVLKSYPANEDDHAGSSLAFSKYYSHTQPMKMIILEVHWHFQSPEVIPSQ